ncbi:hypothetical protein GGD67_003845 [Bradyrhizobium sp. IAR9]|nr:hypothetical protein [Bradyrhizobium sp. IAR9]
MHVLGCGPNTTDGYSRFDINRKGTEAIFYKYVNH